MFMQTLTESNAFLLWLLTKFAICQVAAVLIEKLIFFHLDCKD